MTVSLPRGEQALDETGEPSFFWGVATSAFQIEGSPHADWTCWDPKLNEQPHVTHHYRYYREDLNLLQTLGVNAYRFSIEWSRIQPEEDRWDYEAIEHYQEIVDILRCKGIEPMVTLHHFTHPWWFFERCPWHTERSPKVFLKFVERMASSLKGVRYWITFNEPFVFLLGGYLEGSIPPGLQDLSMTMRALKNILRSHGEAYDILHASLPGACIGIAHNMAVFAPYRPWHLVDRFLARIGASFYNRSLLEGFSDGILRLKLPFKKTMKIEAPIRKKLDFLGVNYYTRVRLKFNPFQRMGVELKYHNGRCPVLTDMGWEIYPEGLEKVLGHVRLLNVPVFITENGIATSNDQQKIDFIRSHIAALERCKRKGIDIRGYFYWSLFDGYEWLKGFNVPFGLFRVDHKTLERKWTEAALFYARLINGKPSI